MGRRRTRTPWLGLRSSLGGVSIVVDMVLQNGLDSWKKHALGVIAFHENANFDERFDWASRILSIVVARLAAYRAFSVSITCG